MNCKKDRFIDWKYPKVEEGIPTKYNWLVQNVDSLELGFKTDIGAFSYINAQYGVIIEDGVFCGPSCVFTNVFNPRATIERKEEFMATLIKEGATIGANATIVCGVTLGKYCFIGAGAVVTKDVPDYALVYGNPATQHGKMDEEGRKA